MECSLRITHRIVTVSNDYAAQGGRSAVAENVHHTFAGRSFPSTCFFAAGVAVNGHVLGVQVKLYVRLYSVALSQGSRLHHQLDSIDGGSKRGGDSARGNQNVCAIGEFGRSNVARRQSARAGRAGSCVSERVISNVADALRERRAMRTLNVLVSCTDSVIKRLRVPHLLED